MSLAMTKDEREAFLAGVHVGVISIEDPGRGPLTAPIWYGYDPGGDVWIVTGAESRKGKLLKAATRFSLVAQQEDPPYKYVSVEGPVTAIEDASGPEPTRVLAHRYLGKEMGDQYADSTSHDGNICVRMKPERWLTVDYAKMALG